jgi:hypothetical protein
MVRVFDFEQVSLLVSSAEETPKASRIKDQSKLLTLIFASKQKQCVVKFSNTMVGRNGQFGR